MLTGKHTNNMTGTTNVQMMPHTTAVNAGLFFGLRGRVIPISSACTSGSQAIGEGAGTLILESLAHAQARGAFGHTLGACGALEAWMSIEMMREGWFAPTLNLSQPADSCGALDSIMAEPRQIETDYIQSNNVAFGGINTSLIFKRWRGV